MTVFVQLIFLQMEKVYFSHAGTGLVEPIQIIINPAQEAYHVIPN